MKKAFFFAAAIVGLLCSISFGASYGGGTGTADDPYLIYTAEQMNTIGLNSNDWASCFKLMADIDMGAYTGTQYNIIGNATTQFTGTFDGNNFKISNLTYSTADTITYVGLFGYTRYATIKDLGIENVNLTISSGRYVGGLAGYQNYCTLTNCYSNGSVVLMTSSLTSYAGGLIGCASSGTITACYSEGSVASSYSFSVSSYVTYSDHAVGGLVGSNSSTITCCSSISSVLSTASTSSNSVIFSYYTGGLAGSNSGAMTACHSSSSVESSLDSIVGQNSSSVGGLVGLQSAAMTNCYSTGDVTLNYSCYAYNRTSYAYAGGLVGRQYSGDIISCYSTGEVTADGSGNKIIGGLIGSGKAVINSFWDIQTSGLDYSGGGRGRTTAELKQSVNYIGWNTLTQANWMLDEGVDCPRLVWENPTGMPLAAHVFSDFVPGTGTSADPYRISTPEQLNVVGLFPDEWGKTFCLENDIDLSVFTGVEFNRIGTINGRAFTGIFDGGGYVVRNMTYTTNGSADGVGLFGGASNATIRDLGLENITISTHGNYVGGLLGLQSSGIITNCYATGFVDTTDISMVSYVNSNSIGLQSYVGGVVGLQDSGTITNCYNMCTVAVAKVPIPATFTAFASTSSAALYAGGLVGHQLSNGVIDSCYNLGTITSKAGVCAGGLAGSSYGIIENSYNAGSIIHSSTTKGAVIGGLVGTQSNGAIMHCYNTGAITSWSSYASYIGGLAGNQWRGTIEDCYNRGSASADSCGYGGGLVGYQYNNADAKIMQCYSTGQVSIPNVTISQGGKGGILGYKENLYYGKSVVASCFWDIETSGLTTSAGGSGAQGKTTAEMKTLSTFTDAGWDFTDSDGDIMDWYMPEDDYPHLINELTVTIPDVVGQTLSDAKTALPAILCAEFTYAISDVVPTGYIVSQSPAAGRMVTGGTTVSLVVSLGKPYSGGTGTAEDPFQIATPQELLTLASDTDRYKNCFILTANIDMAGEAMTPIGTAYMPFLGTFDGNGYVIRNLTYSGTFICGGLFGSALGAVIKNLGVENVDIVIENGFAAGLVGYLYDGTITSCYCSGTVSCLSYDEENVNTCCAGGLVGRQELGTITNCYSKATVTACAPFGPGAGGLVGYNGGGTILNSCNMGTVTSTATSAASDDFTCSSCAGGLVGGMSYYGTVTNCYNTGSVTCSSYLCYTGGLVGEVYSGVITNSYNTGSVSSVSQVGNYEAAAGGLVGHQYDCTVSMCYSTGAVSAVGTTCYKGGLLGYNGWEQAVFDCFWDTQTSGTSEGVGFAESDFSYDGVVGRTTTQMQKQVTYLLHGWDFVGEAGNGTEDVWTICEGTNYPKLVWQIPAADWFCPDGVGPDELSYYWLAENCAGQGDCDGVDLDYSGEVDLADFAIFAQQWLEGI